MPASSLPLLIVFAGVVLVGPAPCHRHGSAAWSVRIEAGLHAKNQLVETLPSGVQPDLRTILKTVIPPV
jgi:hypothetical protein